VVSAALPTAWEDRGLVPGGRIGGYVIDELITGPGDLFVVFNAHDQASGRLVALKVEDPEPGWPQPAKAEFLREVRAVASAAGPNVVPVYAVGESVPSPPSSWADEPPRVPLAPVAATPLVYVAAQFVFGTSLATMLRDGRGRPALDRVLDITTQVGAALDAAHDIGVVHRGVKPANIFLSSFPLSASSPDASSPGASSPGASSPGASPSSTEHVYLADFGQEKVRADVRARNPGSFWQSADLDYFAPEQILGGPVDARADQYSLACVAFHLLAGFAPFSRPDRADTANGHVKGILPSLPAYRADLPFAVDDVFVQAMAKQADSRYDSCGAFAAALRACVA
jgi:serine/threonine protein kinase